MGGVFADELVGGLLGFCQRVTAVFVHQGHTGQEMDAWEDLPLAFFLLDGDHLAQVGHGAAVPTHGGRVSGPGCEDVCGGFAGFLLPSEQEVGEELGVCAEGGVEFFDGRGFYAESWVGVERVPVFAEGQIGHFEGSLEGRSGAAGAGWRDEGDVPEQVWPELGDTRHQDAVGVVAFPRDGGGGTPGASVFLCHTPYLLGWGRRWGGQISR